MISVVVPCYNAKRVLPKCVDSLLNQSFRDLEIILVNDGASDGTLDCIKSYSKKDSRITYVNLEINQGPGKARFAGIMHAKGDYIAFVDADDWLPEDSIETLYTKARHTGSDIVEGRMTRVLGRSGLIKRTGKNTYKEISVPELFDDYFISFFGYNKLSVNLWGKLYKRSLFSFPEVVPSDFRMGEDLILNMQLFPHVKKYCVIPDIVYYYRVGGMTSHYNKHLYPDLKAQYYLKLETIDKYEYYKATDFTKVEMCHVFRSQIKQMLMYRQPKKDIVSFIRQEITSGFIDEITEGVPYPTAKFLSEKNVENIIDSVSQGLWKDRVKKITYRVLSLFV